jgi:CheY-like chemotaxis protein
VVPWGVETRTTPSPNLFARLLGRRDPAPSGQPDTAAEAQRLAELLAVAAHEIRTPLAGIVGLLDLVLAAKLPEAARADAATARQAASDLSLLLRDLIEVPAGIAAPLEARPFRIDEVMEGVVGLLRGRAEAGRTRLATAVAAGTPPLWLGDPARIRQVLVNLVANALRFTEGGEVRIEARESAAGLLELRVSDTGAGIAPERLPRLFERFGPSEGGTGLGLSISRDLAARMGGTISVQSAPGRGTVFTVALKLPQAPGAEPAPAPPAPPVAEPAPAALPVLVVDDVPVNRRLMGTMLARAGFAHEEAGDAATALALVAARSYAAVLMDLEMPEVDGFEATRRLRALPGPAAALPVIAVTAHGAAEVRATAAAAGMDGYLVKPVTPPELTAAIGRAVAARAAR